MKKLTNEQKVAQLSILLQHLEPKALNTLHKSFLDRFNQEIAVNPQKQYVKKMLDAIENGEVIANHESSAGDRLLISMAWQMFSASPSVQEFTHFDEFTRQALASYAVAALKKTKCFLEIANTFIAEDHGESGE